MNTEVRDEPTQSQQAVSFKPTKQDAKHFGCGILMGAADIVPGVSGGTVALILKIYHRLVNAITGVDASLVTDLLKCDFRTVAQKLDLRFTLPLGLGIATGILSLARLMHFLLEYHEARTNAVFCGLILASTLIVSRRIPKWNGTYVTVMLLGLIVAAWFMGLGLMQSPPEGNWYVFVCGMIGICAMILPGVSGAFLLRVLGKYEGIIALLKGLPKGEITMEGFTTIVVFCFGCLAGLLSFSRILKWLLTKHHDLTIALLCGLMLGSLRKLWPVGWPVEGREPVVLLALFVFATAIVLLIDLWAKSRQRIVD
ncbi:MAG: DUF368 domain-containing protein [Planctomycetaceae bacterium]